MAFIENCSFYVKAAMKENKDGAHGWLGDEASICVEWGYGEEALAHVK